MTDKDNFEKRLLSELRQVSAENPSPAPESESTRARPYGRFAAAGAGLAAVVAGVAIYTGTGDNTTSAYAVDTQSDGKVSVEINDLKGATGLEASLAAAGVPAEVSMTPAATVCAVELDPDDIPKGDWKKTAPAPTTEPDGDVVRAIPALPGEPSSGAVRTVPALPVAPAESGKTGIPATATTAAVPIELKKTDADGASFSIDPKEIEEGETVIIAPTQAKPAKLIPAGAPSAAPIAVAIGVPGEPSC